MYEKNAIDYLIELAEKDDCNVWLSYIIKLFIEKRGIIDDDEIDDLADYLLQRKNIPYIAPPSTNFSSKNEKIVLTKLEHHSGVSALSEEQNISFSSQFNIIYGLNGSGKSSYFRILNNMVGNSKIKNIFPNIYSKFPQNIKVNIKYSLDDNPKSSDWSNTSDISDLRSIRVFDTEYTEKYLQRRNSDELLIKPYALSYFSEINHLILKVKELAEKKIKSAKESLPDIILEKLTESFKELLNKDNFTKEDIAKINNYCNFTLEENKQLQNTKKSIEDLNKINTEDIIKINNIKLEKLKKIKLEFENLITLLEEEQKNVDNLVRSRLELTKKYHVAKQQFEVFSKIPGVDSDTWCNFIKSGIRYCEEFKLKDECPYCHQSYDEASLEITKAYSKFIKDTSQTQLDKNAKIIKEKILALQNICQVDLKGGETIPSLEENSDLITLNEQIIKHKEWLLNKLKVSEQEPVEVTKIDDKLLNGLSEEIKNIIQSQIELNSEQEQKKLSLEKYNQQLITLEEKDSLSSQFSQLSKFIEIQNRLFEESKLVSEINTKKLSVLSKKAHTALLTDNLLESFKHNLDMLGLENLSIQLQGSNSKGKQQTELVLAENNNIKDILSEGEQKAVALALFISEISLSNNKSTIIFDDPVNSLDHRIMYNLAGLLLSLENQIIIFTHNKMFLDCLELNPHGHLCKNFDGGCCNKPDTKHIFLYETLSDGKYKKGIIKIKRTENLKNYISDIERLLENSLSDDNKQLVCHKLRRSVEFAIDEIILNRQVPTKYSNKNNRVKWEELKKIKNNPEIIDKLHSIHGRCSGGEFHNGTESEENPIDKDELRKMLNDIKDIQNNRL